MGVATMTVTERGTLSRKQVRAWADWVIQCMEDGQWQRVRMPTRADLRALERELSRRRAVAQELGVQAWREAERWVEWRPL